VTDPAPVVVVGAGIAGLACARVLADAGVPVRVLERGRAVGGRLASRRFDDRPVDLGAAYFTASDLHFAAVVRRWQVAGLARPWVDTFVAYDRQGRSRTNGTLRWAAPGGLRSLAEELATGLPVTVEHAVARVAAGPRVDGEPAGAVVLAMPGPQALRLLDPELTESVGVAAAQEWAPALAVVLRYANRCWADFAGAFVNDHDVLDTVCDDGDRRGDGAPVLVAHTTAGFARGYLDDPAAAAEPVEAAVRELLAVPEAAAATYVHRWTFARPTTPAPAALCHLDGAGIGLAGDAFGPPRVQTAWLSGRAAGQAVVRQLREA